MKTNKKNNSLVLKESTSIIRVNSQIKTTEKILSRFKRKSLKKILIVDDDANTCLHLYQKFQDEKFLTEIAIDGIQALQNIKKNYYNLIILNHLMPGITGEEVLSKVKKNDFTLPVIMLSAKDDPTFIMKCMNLGAADYITKPFEFELLLESVIKHAR